MIMPIRDGWRVARLSRPSVEHVLPEQARLAYIPSKAPRSVHYDLVDARLLADPFASIDNARNAKWVSQADWVYSVPFALAREEIEADLLEVVLPCVDTFSDVFVNGQYLGSTDNMFRAWRFEIPPCLRREANSLVVWVKGHGRMVQDQADVNQQRIGCDGFEPCWSRERTLVRRYQRSYNTDFLGADTHLQGIGIMRPVYVEARSLPCVEQVVFAALEATQARAKLRLEAKLLGATEGALVVFSLSLQGKACASWEAVPQGGRARLEAEFAAPRLWWPRGEGEQALYDLEVRLLKNGRVVDQKNRRVGIRSVRLVLEKENKRKDFQMQVNGRPVYLRGANWIPLDMLNAGGEWKECEKLLGLCVRANMNIIRLWGGGMEEEERFYNRCDELGLMIWQDAHTHSQTYPDYDPDFVETMRVESEEMVTRLRSHPCFALFCGGNEQQEGWDGWNWQVMHDRFYGAKLIYETLAEVAARCCPELPYIPNSPYGQKLSQSPVDGDTHTWGNFYNATEDPLFVTETCWYYGTLSRLETLKELYGLKEEEFQGLRWHKKFEALTGHVPYQVNQYSEYHKLGSLAEYLFGLEIEQLRADYTALFYLRTRSPSCRGIIYWPMNKGGPMQGYGCVDYHGRPLITYYNVARLFKDAVIHIYRDGSDVCVVAANAGKSLEGELLVSHRHTDGRVFGTRRFHVSLPRKEHIRLCRLEGLYDQVADRWSEYVYARLEVNGEAVFDDCLYFCPFVEVEVQPQRIKGSLRSRPEGGWLLRLETPRFAKLVTIEANQKAVFSDNAFAMQPGEAREIEVTSLEDAPEKLSVTVRALDNDEQLVLSE